MALVSIWEKLSSSKDFSMINTAYLLFSAYLLFLVQLMSSANSVGANNIILANVVAVAGSLSFYLIGFTFAFGSLNLFSPIITDDLYLMSFFLFQWAFAVATAGIASGSVPAETTRLNAHLIFSFFLTGFVYPVVAHWAWSSHGWLSPSSSTQLLFGSGAIDFAGSGVVHLVGGVAGFLGSLMVVDPKLMSRFRTSAKAMPPVTSHRATMVVLGLSLLWFGFNPDLFEAVFHEFYPGKTNQGSWILWSLAAANATLAASTAGIVTLFGRRFLGVQYWDDLDACNGLLGGFVAISSGCFVVEPWAAVVCGFFAACILIMLTILARKLQFDDSLGAAQLHGGFGVWGLIFTGLFAKKELVIQVYRSYGESDGQPFGLLVGGGWGLLGAQVLEILVILGWVTMTMGPLFYILHKLRILRISTDDEEITSIDISSLESCDYIQSKQIHGYYTRIQDEQ
ncbi:Ammonium transporter [Parasponia andersonii]|uniref:Ammonium transporter n=1 Tax=Parasponia andersonii TaxID=3476 RepID=A0A2P5AL22_PARAD|nr:Ammonium transporter [Parasponia andersonii]